MVSPDEREKLSEYLLPRYSTEVNAILKAKGINPEKEVPFSAGFISNVFIGVYENADIEAAFYEIYEKRKAKKDELEWKKNRFNAQTA